jgi:hypothetical protein
MLHWCFDLRESIRSDPTWHFSRLRGPCASWLKEKTLDEQRRLLPDSTYRRLWLNEWASGDADAVFAEADIAACIDGALAPVLLGSANVLGLDLGQAQDPSALSEIKLIPPVHPAAIASVRRRLSDLPAFDVLPLKYRRPWDDPPAAAIGDGGSRPTYQCINLRRWPLHTSYTSIVADVARIVHERYSSVTLVLDASGCGRPVAEMVRGALIRTGCVGKMVSVVITGGFANTPADGFVRVSKVQLVSAFQVALQNRRFTVAAWLPEQKALLNEMRTFKMRVTSTGAETFAAQGRAHDDLLMSCMLPVWLGETIQWQRRPAQSAADGLHTVLLG